MDRGGRRRRLFTALGTALGLLLGIGGALLVAGLLGASPVPLPGLPRGGRQGLVERGGAGEVGVVPTASHARRTTAAPAPQSRTASAPAPVTATTTDRPGNRPTSKPGNAKPSRTK